MEEEEQEEGDIAVADSAVQEMPVIKPEVAEEPRKAAKIPHGPADNSETDSADEIGASNNAAPPEAPAFTNASPSLHSNGSIGQVS